MITCVLSFLLGICSVYIFSHIPSYELLRCAFLLSALITFIIIFLPKLKLHYLLAFFLGFLWVSIQVHWHFDKQLPENLQGQPLTVVGTIASIPSFKDQNAHFEFDIERSEAWQHPGRVQLTWREYQQQTKTKPKVGEKWKLTLKLKRPRAYANPGSFDTERHFFQNRLHAKGSVISSYRSQAYTALKLEDSFLNHPLDRLRARIREIFSEHLKGRAMGGLITALVVGIQDDITEDQWAVFRNTGTAHLMAISGLHVGLVAGFAFLSIMMLWACLPSKYLKIPAPWIGAVGALTTALVYALLAGFSIPTQRSLVMVTLLMLGFLSKRIISGWRSYCLALGLILIWDPLSTLTVGFWLSFGAVGVILYGMGGRLKPGGLWWKWGRAQWVVFLGLIPISLAAFQQMSLVAPLANIIAIPWVSVLVVPLSLVGSFCTICSIPMGEVIIKAAEQLLTWLWPFLEWLSHVPRATWMNAEATPLTLGLAFVGILLLLAPRGFPGKSIGIFWLLPLFLIQSPIIPTGAARLTVLDVGQGLSTVIETRNHTLVFDTGPKLNTHFDTGDRVVVPFLATRGRSHIDTLIISHGDNDHMGGAQSILKQLKVSEILTSEPQLFPDQSPKACWVGQQWQWDDVHFEIIHPDSTHTKKRNDHSCVLRVQAGKQSVLITGDIEAKSEKKIILREREKIKSNILIVPHHGSQTSSCPEFIQAVSPSYAIIPVGYKNQYGHPKQNIVERYQQANIKLLNTINDGAITFLLQNTEILSEPERYRMDNRKYWSEF